MFITKINSQVSNPDRVNIFVDGRYSLSLDLNQLLESKLKVGLEIDELELKKLQKMSSDGKIKMRALEWLMMRPHSKKELKDYLKQKKVDGTQINEWTNYFQTKGYQDDEKFAKWWVEQRRHKAKSKAFICQELLSKGIDKEIIDGLIGDVDEEKKALATLIAKKRKNIKFCDNKKLTEYLLRQGYSYSLIKELLAE